MWEVQNQTAHQLGENGKKSGPERKSSMEEEFFYDSEEDLAFQMKVFQQLVELWPHRFPSCIENCHLLSTGQQRKKTNYTILSALRATQMLKQS